ncbi:MAG: tetratricopeptide repeat protein [Verrucomicrobia bacterium]|nr:tetratricopeptide repeat protein [Verrucomicrobiota bacterium]
MTRRPHRFILHPSSFILAAALVAFAATATVRAADAPKPPTAKELIAEAVAASKKGEVNAAYALAEKAVTLEPKSPDAHYAFARMCEERRDLTNALAHYSRVIELDPKSPEAFQFRGTTHFKLGQMTESIEDFDQFLELVPSQKPHHWQRGIACYYAGQFDEGRRQFEMHRVVNPNDVENATWHFLCNARARGLDRAKDELIPISGDDRVPMKEIYELFQGKGDEASVMKAAGENREKTSPAEHRNRMFYAHLYLGIYAEARGDAKAAREHIEKAAGEFAMTHYMGDVAKVHLQLMKKEKK